jgi:hypothetical protein
MVGNSGSCDDSTPKTNSDFALVALSHWKCKTIIMQRQMAPPVGLKEGRLAPLWPPLPLFETEDYNCEMTKKIILWSVIAFPVYVIA